MLWGFSIEMRRLFVSIYHRPTLLFYTVSLLALKDVGKEMVVDLIDCNP